MRKAALISGGLAAALALGSSGTVEPAQAAVVGLDEQRTTTVVSSVEDLGVPISTVRLTASISGYWTDGRPVVYTAGGQPEQPLDFVVLDAETGEQLDSHTITDTNGAHNMLLAPDGNVYISAWGPHAYLLRYSPETREITNLGHGIPDDVVITQTIAGEDGMLYGGGYPSGKVFSYDTGTGEFEDLGVAVEGEQYARSLTYAPGQLFVGTEAQARLVSIDLETGERTPIENPEWAGGETRHFHLEYRDGLLFSYTSPSLDWHVYDVAAGEWIDRIERNAQGGMTEVDENGNVYFVKLTDGLYRYNIEERVAEPVGWSQQLTSAMGATGISLIDLQDPEWPGQTVVGMGNRGDMWMWNPQTEQGEMRTTDSPSYPMTIRSLGLGPDGNVYIGGGTSEVTVGGYDTTAEEVLSFTRGPSARVDAIETLNDKVYFTTYGQGILFEYDPSREYNYGNNPRQVFRLYEDYHQERIYALETVDDHTIALGTIGGRGIDTGQLFLYNDETQEKTDLGEPLPGHAIASLTSTDGYLIGGTTVDVLGGDSPHSEARIFIWDLEAGEVVWDGVPEPGAKDISALTTDADGQVWGLSTSGSIFQFDVDSRELFDPIDVGASGGLWGHGSLEFGPDERLYGSTAVGETFAFDPSTGAVEDLADGEYALFDNEGRLYYAWDGTLYRMTFAEVIEVVPAEVVFTDGSDGDQGSYSIPSVEGVAYRVDGETVPPGTHPGAGSVEVEATALEGYVIAEGATTQWSYTFEAPEPGPGGPTDPADPTDPDAPSDPADPTDPGDPSEDPAAPDADDLPATGLSPMAVTAIIVALLLVTSGVVLIMRRRPATDA